jgi:PAS domain S-box-containing protein
MTDESVLRNILEQSLAGYWDWDIPTGAAYMSPAFKKMFGYEDHELPNRIEAWRDLMFAEDRVILWESFNAHVKSKGAVQYCNEVRYFHKDGSTIRVICIGKVIEWDEMGNPKRMAGCHIDITNRRNLDETVRENQEYHKQLLDNLLDCIVLLDVNGIQKYVSSAAKQLLGFSPSELTGISVIDEMVHRDDQTYVKESLAGVIAGESAESINVQYRHRHKNGQWVWLEARASNQLNNPTVQGIIITIRDITKRKATEEALRQQESYLTTIIENQPGLVWLKDKECRFLSVNKAFAHSCGLEDTEMLAGKSDFDIWPQELAQKYREDDMTVMASDRPKIVEELIADQGEQRWFETFKAPVKDLQGAIIGTTGYARDITERKKAEAERAELNRQLYQMQKLESLGILAGGIAHDFNNLLSGIFGFIDLAYQTSTDEEVSDYLSNALGTIERVRNLTRQLLTFAKCGAPIKKLEHLQFFIEETVKFALSGSSVSARFSIAGNLWPCEIDRNQIGQVINNLVINAVQAMPGGGLLEVSAENVTLNRTLSSTLLMGKYVKISIKDHGAGIAKEVIAKIFDPFFTTKQKGHGLGLATCYSIINRHGGLIDVVSEAGKGSAFTFLIPALPNCIARTANDIDIGHTGSGTFLIMDDEEVIRVAIGKTLEFMGYTVRFALDGKDAIDFFETETKANREIAGAIFDLTIPGGLGGKDAIARIREFDKKTPVFVASGYAEDPVMARPDKFGFNGSISKPFKIVEFAELLNKHRKFSLKE